MTEENINGRQIVLHLLKNYVKIDGIIIERSRLSEKTKSFLKNDYYNPPFIRDMVINKQIPLYFVSNHNNQESLSLIKSLKPMVIVLGGTRILKKEIIDAVEIGIVNIHPGMLPFYRGQDVVGWSILNGDDVGVTTHFITEEIDAGPILMQKKMSYKKGDSLLKIRVKAMILGGILASATLLNLEKITPKTQNHNESHRYYKMNEKEIKKVEEKLRK